MGKAKRLVRRAAPRAEVDAAAFVVCDGGHIGPLAVENLSVGGALLRGEAPWQVGQALELALHLGEGALLRVSATALRSEQRGARAGMAVRFQGLSAAVQNAIQSAVMASIERTRSRARTAIVVVSPRGRDQALAAGIWSIGAVPLIVATFLDALRWLQDPGVLVRGLIVDIDAEGGLGVEAMAWCAEEFPAVRRVLLLPELADAGQLGRSGERWTLLARPVTPRALSKALGRSPTRRGRLPRPSESSGW